MNEMKILFEITNCDSHIAMYEPIINALRDKSPHCKVQVLSLCEVEGFYTNQHKVASIAQEILQPYKTPFRLPERKGGLIGKARNGIPYIRLLWKKHKIGEHIEKLIESLQPDVVILPNDRLTPNVTLIKAAKKREIPTLLVQESIRKDDHFKISRTLRLKLLLMRHLLGIEEGGLILHGQGGCDQIAAWGETSRKYFKRIGVSKEKVILTGNPRIESITKMDWQTKGHELKQRYSIPESASVIAFITNPVDWMYILSHSQLLESATMVVNTVAPLEDVYLFLKPHFYENVEKYRQVITKSPARGRIYIESDIELYPLLSISDACLIFNSTAALEAAVLGVPVAVINPFQVDLGIDFVENGLAVEITNKEQLIDFLKRCRSGQYSIDTNAIQKYLAIIDGSADKIADEIIKGRS